jgi:hypothetical protein
MTRWLFVLLSALLGVAAGRSLRLAASPSHTAAPSLTAAPADETHAAAAAPAQVASLQPLLQRLAAIPAPDARAQRLLATVREPDDAKDLRHETQLADLRKRGISLGHDALDHYLRVTDWMVQEGRLDRVRYLLGELSEQDYLDARAAAVRQAFTAYQQKIGGDDFRRLFGWQPHKDPFDATGSTAKAWSATAPAGSCGSAVNKDPSVPPNEPI